MGKHVFIRSVAQSPSWLLAADLLQPGRPQGRGGLHPASWGSAFAKSLTIMFCNLFQREERAIPSCNVRRHADDSEAFFRGTFSGR